MTTLQIIMNTRKALNDHFFCEWLSENEEKLRKHEELTITQAMYHTLDEDGHTGDWKVKFVNDYYEQLKNK
jgi:hypothetical protein